MSLSSEMHISPALLDLWAASASHQPLIVSANNANVSSHENWCQTPQRAPSLTLADIAHLDKIYISFHIILQQR